MRDLEGFWFPNHAFLNKIDKFTLGKNKYNEKIFVTIQKIG